MAKSTAAVVVASIVLGAGFSASAQIENPGGDPLRVFLSFDGMLSMSHNVENFMVPNSSNKMPDSDDEMNDMDHAGVENHLILTALAYIDGEVAGIVSETEYIPDFNNRSHANSVWLLKLSADGYDGWIMVEQIEGPGRYADPDMEAKMQEVQQTQSTENVDIWLRTTSPGTRVQYASHDLAKYQGGLFVEYSAINPGDPSRNGVVLEFYLPE